MQLSGTMNVRFRLSYKFLLIDALKPRVSDVHKYFLHSLRLRGAAIAANNGVNESIFKRHERW